jgi:acylglycerol lipase
VRRWPWLGLLLLVASCASEPLPMPRDTQAPAVTEHALVMADGVSLPLRKWLPEGKPRAVILALHGFNDYSKAFEQPAKIWAKDGIATYAYDQRGFGEAPAPGRWFGTAQLDTDLAAASRLLRAQNPGVPLYLLGESMGGAVVVTALAGSAGTPKPEADGIILSAPAVWGRSTMNVFERVALSFGETFFPATTLTGRGLNIVASDNVEVLRELGRDPLVIKATRIDAIAGLADLMDQALAAAPRLEVPMLLLYGTHDEIVPENPTRLFIAGLRPAESADARVALYDHGYHLLLRDLEAHIVLADIESWIGDHGAALPSGADRRAREGLLARR